MEVREVLSREGRDAKNLLVYQFCDDSNAYSSSNNHHHHHHHHHHPNNNSSIIASSGLINGEGHVSIANYRKPPVAPPRSPNSLVASSPTPPKKCVSPTTGKQCQGPRVRSASTGRDKKSELQARYWALLFGNLQRAVNEIYQTVECYENISSCQEAILVLENYVRDFKALSEWFKVSWDYESRTLQQRPQSLAWEVRKSNPAPRVRARSLSSPTASGKSSPALHICSSGKTSPCCVDGQISPKKMLRAYDQLPKGAMRVNVRELFASSKRTQEQIDNNAQQLPTTVSPLSPLPQAGVAAPEIEALKITEADIMPSGMMHQYSQTDLEDDHLTLADLRKKQRELQEEQHRLQQTKEFEEAQRQDSLAAVVAAQEEICEMVQPQQVIEVVNLAANIDPIVQTQPLATVSAVVAPNTGQLENKPTAVEDAFIIAPKLQTALELTTRQLDAMENALLGEQISKPAPTPTPTPVLTTTPTTLKQETDIIKKTLVAPTITQSSPLKYSSVLNRSKANTPATNLTTTVGPNAAASKAVKPNIGISKSNPIPGTNGLRRTATSTNVPNRTSILRGSARSTVAQQPPRPSSKTECHGPPTNVATRLSARSRTMIDMANGNNNNSNNAVSKIAQKPLTRVQPVASTSRLTKSTPKWPLNSSRKSSREDIGSSNSTLKASNEQLEATCAISRKTNDDRQGQAKQTAPDANDGWLTVKTRRRSSMHWANRFHQPTGYASLPTLALLNEQEQEQKREKAKTATEAAAAAATAAAENKKTLLASQSSQAASTTGPTVPRTNAERAAKPNGKLHKPTEKVTKPVPVRPEIKNAKAKVNSLPVQKKNVPNNIKKPEKTASVGNNTAGTSPSSASSSATLVSRQAFIKRQKSDLTGLKMTSLHKEYMRSEKHAQRKLQQQQQQLLNDREHSNISSSAETVVEASNNNNNSSPDMDSGGDHNKIDIKIQTNREFSKTIGELYESIARTNKIEKLLANGCWGKSGTTGLSSCDENDENSLASCEDIEEERNERMLMEEQELLERQIRELESTEIDVDTETDETDCEVVLEDPEESNEQAIDNASAVVFVTMSEDENISLELRYQALLSEMSWNERAETLATLQAFVTRYPGRAQELHQKLSSPSRRRSLQETLKKYQVKQARAQEKRELLHREKANKLQQLLTRVEAVKTAKKQLIEDKRQKMEGRLQRAAENRELYLRQIVEKAHDEEKKLKEINFIRGIEAQNKRLDWIESSKESEGRLQDLEQERQKRLEEKAAKEAAVERRRLALERERQRKLEKMNETRLEKEQRIGKMQEQKERQRQELAREKARDREERLLALQAQQQQTTEELQRKILQKQLESARRHEENIEQIRQRAVELTLPTRIVDEPRPEEENDENRASGLSEDCDHSSTISDVGSREHSRSYKKKMKKLKHRMAQCAAEYFNEMEPLPVHVKRESQVPKLLHLITKGGGNQGLERDLGNLLRLLPKAQVSDFQTFLRMDGLGIVTTNVIAKGLEENSDISRKSVTLAVHLYRNACSLCPQVARHALLGNSITVLFDSIIKSMQLPEEKSPQQPVELSTELMLACTEALSSKYVKKSTHPKVPERLPDMINYAVITGLIEMLSRRCMKIRESIENHQSVMLSLLTTLGFFSRFIDVCPPGPADPTRLLNAAKSTDLFGTVSMLYASVVPIGECIPKRTISLAASAFNLFVSFATLDINTFQDIVSSESVSVKLFDVMTILMNYCGNKSAMMKNSETQTMMIDLIATISLFCVNKRKNQDLLASEQCSIIVKSLTKLPEFYNPVIYPCLVTMTYKNQTARTVLGRDFDMELLEEYRKSETAKKNHLIALIKDC